MKPSISSPSATATTADARTYNTRKLGLRLSADAAAAAAAGVLVAPVITVIDRGIMENASGRRKLGESVRASLREMVGSKGAWFLGRPFRLVFVGYVYLLGSVCSIELILFLLWSLSILSSDEHCVSD
jgi:hypothetical protein